MFGISVFEIVFILMIGVVLIGIPIGIVGFVILLQKHTNSNADSLRIAQLQEENRNLRDELASRQKTSQG